MASVDHRTCGLGNRIVVKECKATIKYIGQVQGTDGIWYGVDWDDPSRGRHNGTKDRVQYFTTRYPGSGSFIRPSPSIIYGQSFLQALKAKYIESTHVSDRKEVIILGSSNGAIEVEAVGLDKVRNKLSKLERLSEISLDTENVAYPDASGEIRRTCPNILSLDLSHSLLPSWEMVAIIANDLQYLRSLSLNHTRLALPSEPSTLQHVFPNLEELRLDETLITWPEVLTLMRYMPRLRYLELGYNKLQRLRLDSIDVHTALEIINFDGNELNEWADIMLSLRNFTSLKRLVLTMNHISQIPLPTSSEEVPATSITHLGLQQNQISQWSDIDALNAWLPDLQTLSIMENPLVEGKRDSRSLIISRLPCLTSLNGVSIPARERTDSELYYLSQIAKSEYASDELRNKAHPRWQALCQKHGTPDTMVKKVRDTLGDRLIEVIVYLWDSKTVDDHESKDILAVPNSITKMSLSQLSKITLRVLPTMSLRAFRLRLLKELRRVSSDLHHAPGNARAKIRVWLVMRDNELTELTLTQDYDLAWWGIEEGSQLLVSIANQ